MSGPQVEDGYTRIANELLEAIIRADLSKRQSKIVWAVIRKTYGYNKKTDDMTNSQLVESTGLNKSNVTRTVAELTTMNVLLKRQGRYTYLLELNKNYKKWTCYRSGSVAKTATGVAKTAIESCQNGKHKRQLTKDNITKEKEPIDTFPPEFLKTWKMYPKRSGDNPKKQAFHAWQARRQEGHAVADIEAGVMRYAEFCRATEKTETEFIMQAKRFFGPSKPFQNSWKPPQKQPEPGKIQRAINAINEAENDAIRNGEKRIGENVSSPARLLTES